MIWQTTELPEKLVSFFVYSLQFSLCHAKVFQPSLFSFCKNTQRALSLSNWLKNNRRTIGSIIPEQWQNKRELSLSKMYLVLTKQNCNSSESSAGFVNMFFFHQLHSGFPQFSQGIVFDQSDWLVYCMQGQSFIYIAMCIPQCLLALSYFSGCNV